MGDRVRIPLGIRIVATYCIVVSAFLAVQTAVVIRSLALPSRMDVTVFFVLVLLGLALLPIWLLRPAWLPWALVIWWLPQLLVVSVNQYYGAAGATSTPVWNATLLFFFGPNVGSRIDPNTYRLVHLNVVAFVALTIVAFVGIVPAMRRLRRGEAVNQEESDLT